MKHNFLPVFGEPQEKGVSEWQTFNAVRRDTGAYTVSAFPTPAKPKNIVRYKDSPLLILKRA